MPVGRTIGYHMLADELWTSLMQARRNRAMSRAIASSRHSQVAAVEGPALAGAHRAVRHSARATAAMTPVFAPLTSLSAVILHTRGCIL